MSQTILNIKQLNRKSDGRPQYLIQTELRDHWVTVAAWVGHGYKTFTDSYIGGAFDCEYYKEGELLLNGTPATSSDVILKEFFATMSPAIAAQTTAAIAIAEGAALVMKTSLFNRNRPARVTAPAAPAAPTAEEIAAELLKNAAPAPAPAAEPAGPIVEPVADGQLATV